MVCHAGVLVYSGLGDRHHSYHALGLSGPYILAAETWLPTQLSRFLPLWSQLYCDPGSRCPRLVSAAQLLLRCISWAPLLCPGLRSPHLMPYPRLLPWTAVSTDRPYTPALFSLSCWKGPYPRLPGRCEAALHQSCPTASSIRAISGSLSGSQGTISVCATLCHPFSEMPKRRPAGEPKGKTKAKCSRRRTTLLSTDSSHTPSDLVSPSEAADTMAPFLASSSGPSSRSEATSGVAAPAAATGSRQCPDTCNTGTCGSQSPSRCHDHCFSPSLVSTVSKAPRGVDGTAAGTSGGNALRISYSSASSSISATICLLRMLLSVPTS